MSPYLDHQRGKFVLERQYPGIGRIKRSSGTLNTKLFREQEVMLDRLFAAGRFDLLRCLQRGALHPITLLEKYRAGELHMIPVGKSALPITDLRAWAGTLRCSESHIRSVRLAASRLEETAGRDATIADLPGTLLVLREKYADRPRMFNLIRGHTLRFLAEKLGKRSGLYGEVLDTSPIRYRPSRTPAPSLQELQRIGRSLGRYEPMFWSIALTGLRRGEYWGSWEVADGRLSVRGTKTAAAARVVPVAIPGYPCPPSSAYQAFRRKLATVTNACVSPHDLRASFATNMELAGVPRSRRKLYLGHTTPADVTDLYERPNLEEWIAEDAKRLAGYFAPVFAGGAERAP